MQIEPNDLDYKLIDQAFEAQKEVSQDWVELEDIYRNIVDECIVKDAKALNRSFISTPIARDTVLIKRSIFSSSFQIEDLPISISRLGEEDSEAARQLRIACAYYWDIADIYVELNKAMLRMLIFPIGIVFDYWDANKKRYVLEECNPTDIAFDYEARNSSDVQYLVYRYRKSGRDIRSIILADAKKKKGEKFYNRVNGHYDFFRSEYNERTFQPFKRYELKEVYIKQGDGWLCKTYYPEGNVLLREVKFSECPFKWGFVREKLSSVDDNKRAKQIMVYGESEIDFIKEYVKLMNQRRNQHSDIVEEQINPSVYIGTGAKVNAKDLKRGAGAKIPVGDISQIQERRAPTTMGIHDDLAMLKEDIETTTSVNGLYKAQTSSSDRRATGALAMLSSQASTRIEEQIMTANRTLFNHIAKSFVRKVYRYADGEVLRKLGIKNPIIGVDAIDKEPFDFTVKVHFGSDMKRDKLFNTYMQALQVLGQFQNINSKFVDKLMEEALRTKLPDDFSIDEEVFEHSEDEQEGDDMRGIDAVGGVTPGI